nr:hypothetical protein [Rhodococcus sp. (in: high G+C Gram-positive bacteria)]
MSTPAEIMNWTAEEHRGKAVEIMGQAIEIYKTIDQIPLDEVTSVEFLAVGILVNMAQVQATLALSAPGLPVPAAPTYNIQNQLGLPEYL